MEIKHTHPIHRSEESRLQAIRSRQRICLTLIRAQREQAGNRRQRNA